MEQVLGDFLKITLPSLANLVFVNTIYTIVLLATFSENEVIKTSVPICLILRRYGMASAMAWVFSDCHDLIES